MDLSDAYANAAHIPGAQEYPPRWSQEAAAFRDGLGSRATLGVSYGPSARQVYDLFQPNGPAKGTVVFVHGGYWRAFDRSVWSHLAAGPLARGWAVAMPSYDLCPTVRITDITRQIARAVTAIAAETTGPIALTGHSAGGHLVARMTDPTLLTDNVAARLTCVLPISPVSDLRPLLQTDINADLRLDMAEAEAESPLLMTARRQVPTRVWVGGDERPVFIDQARWLAEGWGADLVIVDGRHHFDVIDALKDPASDMVVRLTGAEGT